MGKIVTVYQFTHDSQMESIRLFVFGFLFLFFHRLKTGWRQKIRIEIKLLEKIGSLYSQNKCISRASCWWWSHFFECQCKWKSKWTVCDRFVLRIKQKTKQNKNHFACCRFIVKDRCTSYSGAQRSLMVMQVLLRTKYDDSDRVSQRNFSNLLK